MDASLGALFYPLAFHKIEFCDEVSDYLPFNSRARSIVYVEFI